MKGERLFIKKRDELLSHLSEEKDFTIKLGVTSRPRWRRSELAREGNGRRQAGFVREPARSYRQLERVIERPTGYAH